ncbi:WD40 repeat-like protein [Auricularia subglabra TFB-10046 SS5]|nr:WD40 repeat-like protein [Auricularia subglabra TFB-10046 SS5]
MSMESWHESPDESVAGGTSHSDAGAPDISRAPSPSVEIAPEPHAPSGATEANNTKNTNVVELYSRLVKDEHQLTFYNSGIGTYAKPSWKSMSYRKQVIANKLDLAFALRFEKIILSAYAWLVDNYQPGDRIFLFGFSRGAYQVRALSAMVDVVGLLYKGNNDQIPFAYELYAASREQEQETKLWDEARSLGRRLAAAIASRTKRVPPEQKGRRKAPAKSNDINSSPATMQDQFKNTFSRPDVRVHFVGAWDTVSSVGFIRDKTLPKTTDGMKSACFFRHALALHECRVKFLPEYVNGSNGPEPEYSRFFTKPHTKEVWFMGSHSDIGGGSTANPTLDKFGPALRWMSSEATLAGLRIKEGPRKWEQVNVSKSMSLVWWIVEYLPIKRLSYTLYPAPSGGRPGRLGVPLEESFSSGDVGSEPRYPEPDILPKVQLRKNSTTWMAIQPGQLVHQSVSQPEVPFGLPGWTEMEIDTHVEASIVLREEEEVLQLGRVIDEGNAGLLALLTSTARGIRSLKGFGIAEYIYTLARSCRNSPSAPQILKDLRALDVAFVKGAALTSLGLTLPDDAFEAVKFRTSETFAFGMYGHLEEVTSVVFLSNTRAISASQDQTLRIWDVSTGEMTLGDALLVQPGFIKCVALCSAGGLIASASDRGTIRVWTSDSAGALQEHRLRQLRCRNWSEVGVVAFSPDGLHLVSGGLDGAVYAWDTVTGGRIGEPLREHTAEIRALAFSSNGRRVVSGSDDHTVRLWSWSPGGAALRARGAPLVGHTSSVTCVAFSPDARLIASGSGDHMVRLWDANARTLKLKLEGHSGSISSIAFAPGGMTRVASASYDWTVRVWDTDTGAVVRVLVGHSRWVRCVAFSPDGARIASGSKDETVRVWDLNLVSDDEQAEEDDDGYTAEDGDEDDDDVDGSLCS